jgi:very-short-patch-repair endonuclease
LIPPPIDRLIATLARSQHGVVTRAQLRELGLSDSAIGRRLAAGQLHTVHHGVYAVGHDVLGPRGRWLAAVLACGPTAALSHAAAGALWELRRSAAAKIHVTVPRTGRRHRPGLRIHRPRALPEHRPDDPSRHPRHHPRPNDSRLRRHAPEKTARTPPGSGGEHDVASLEALDRAHPGHHGANKLLVALTRHTPGTTLTRSELEELFLELCHRARLPRPSVNAWVEGLEVDFLFPEQRVIVETDSWRHHRTRHAFERDRQRDAVHARVGYRTLRFTHHQLTAEPRTLAQAVTAALTSDDQTHRLHPRWGSSSDRSGAPRRSDAVFAWCQCG